MKAGRERFPLGSHVDVIMGQAPSSKECNFDGRGTPFVKVGEFSDVRPITREWTTNPLKLARRSDVLICVVGATCGKINLGEDCAIGRSVAAIRPNPQSLDQFFLYYFLMTLVESLRSGSLGAAQTVISKEMISKISIPIPPLSEQAHIVGILDEAFASIATAKANTEKNLENAKAVFESHLNSVFSQTGEGWVEKKLGDVCEIKGGGTPSKSVNEYWTGDIPWVSPKDMKSEVVSDSIDHISERAITASATNLVPKDSILMVVRSGILARIVPVAITGQDLTINQDIKALCPSKELNCWFLFYLLQGKMGLLLDLVSRGATVHRIITEQIREISFLLPPLSIQDQLVAEIKSLSEETSRLTSLYTQKLAALEDLKKSLLHQAFTGKLQPLDYQ
jgi:type I restriction enzyme S subunit